MCPSRQDTGLVLIGLAAAGIALQDGLALLAPLHRVLTRVDPRWLVLGGVAIAAAGLLAMSRSRRDAKSDRERADADGQKPRRTAEFESRSKLLPVALSVGALLAVLVGVHTESLHAAASSGYTVQTGWDGPLNYQELELVELAALGVLGALAAVRWRRAAYGTLLAGGLVLVYPIRFLADRFESVSQGLDVGGGTTIDVSFGAEPYLLLFGGTVLVLAGVAGIRGGLPGARRFGALLRSSTAT